MNFMDFIKKNKTYIISIVLTLLAGSLGALLSADFDIYKTFQKPALAPPAILFPIVWTFLYTLMGYAAGLVAESRDLDKGIALKLYGLQLAVNIIWPIIFFGFNAIKFALFWMLLLIILVVVTYKNFRRISHKAGLLLLPYILWLLFAFYLNFSIIVLNS